MPVLSPAQLIEIRRSCSADDTLINFSKAQANLAIQAIEDWFEVNRASLNTAINTATAPLVLSATVKKRLVAFWLRQKFGREV